MEPQNSIYQANHDFESFIYCRSHYRKIGFVPGVKRQVVHCVERTFGIVEKHYCDASTQPDENRVTCNAGLCLATWVHSYPQMVPLFFLCLYLLTVSLNWKRGKKNHYTMITIFHSLEVGNYSVFLTKLINIHKKNPHCTQCPATIMLRWPNMRLHICNIHSDIKDAVMSANAGRISMLAFSPGKASPQNY